MKIKTIAQNVHYSIERRSGFNHCANEQVEWVVRGNKSQLVVACYSTKKEAMIWLNDLTIN